MTNRFRLLQNIINQRLKQKKRTLVFCSDVIGLNKLTEEIWGDELIFIPHLLNDSDGLHLVSLSNNKIDCMDDTIINYSNVLINGFNRYLKLIEIVSTDNYEKEQARVRYKFFKDCGYDIEHIDVNKIRY